MEVPTLEEGTRVDAAPATLAPRRRSRWGDLARLWRKYDMALIGGTFFLIVLVVSLLAPVFSPYDPAERNIRLRLQGPSWEHPFGLDEMGRDVLSRTIYGGRSVLVTGFAALAVSLAIGLVIGVVSAYWGGWVDSVLMRLVDIMLSFPSVLLAILIVTSLGVGIQNVVLAIAVAQIPVFARLVRSIVLVLVHQDYVEAAQSLGAGSLGIIRRHIFPNMIPPVLVQTTSMLAVTIATLTALNYLGLGVETGTPDWGMMVADGQKLLFDAPHVPIFPGLILTLTVMSVNLIGDGLRDHLDPRLRLRV